MATYKCLACGNVFDEEARGETVSETTTCPVCGVPSSMFMKISGDGHASAVATPTQKEPEAAQNEPKPTQYESEPTQHEATASASQPSLAYEPSIARVDPTIRGMDIIHDMAVNGRTVHAAMATEFPMPSWDDILLLGAQLDPMPLDEGAPVNTTTIIGPNAAKPLVLQNPVFVSHMSFGALSKEAKVALARGTAQAGSAMCSGEGGILEEEMKAADKYIFEYVANQYSVTPENLKNADAIEIKIGQGTKPGMGGHLPAEKVTPEISAVRGKPMGQDVLAPSRFPGIETADDMRTLVSKLREESEGRPIGIKIAAGHIESDIAFCLTAHPDFITIDGRGGATGSSPQLLRDASSVPTIYALARARAVLDKADAGISLIITGGLRTSADFAKALAMGADAVAVATGALMALGCQQYRICGSGKCPMGIATHDEKLRARLDVDIASQRVSNYLNVSLEELKTVARITGHERLHDFSLSDLVTISREISEHTPIAHA